MPAASNALEIAILTREYPPHTRVSGGIGTQLAHLAPALARQGHAVTVIALGRDGARRLEEDGVRLELLARRGPAAIWPLDDLAWSVQAERALARAGRFDAVFAAEWGGDGAVYARRQRSGPLVTGLTSSLRQILEIMPGWQRSRRWRARHLVQDRLERRQAEGSAAVLACSQAILDWARRLWDIGGLPSEVVPNAVPVARTRRLAVEGAVPEGFPTGGPVVAYSGRLEGRKGVQVLVEAMREVWAERPDAALALLGQDTGWNGRPMSAHLRELAGPHAGRIHVLGPQPPERLFAALARADLVAIPSLWENFPLAGVEAMALGRPVVASASGGLPEMVRDGVDGLLVAPGDPAALGAAIVRLLDDTPLRERLGASAAAAAAERFDVDAVAERYAAWFRHVAASAR